jgi:hypothetical protein
MPGKLTSTQNSTVPMISFGCWHSVLILRWNFLPFSFHDVFLILYLKRCIIKYIPPHLLLPCLKIKWWYKGSISTWGWILFLGKITCFESLIIIFNHETTCNTSLISYIKNIPHQLFFTLSSFVRRFRKGNINCRSCIVKWPYVADDLYSDYLTGSQFAQHFKGILEYVVICWDF